VYFYTGLLRLMDDESQLMAVMAHEVSHVVARHGMKRLQSALIAQMGYEVVFGRSGDSQVRDAAIAIGLTMVFSDYSRDAEREADQFGVHYMVKAGYDPRGALGMFQHLAAAGERNPNVFEKMLSSHPETQERIANVERQIANMGPLSPGLAQNRERYSRMKSRLPAAPSDSAGGQAP
ncbi:MAG TPA: M48 family metallopeptidase, partial [candidate division Zixibacteria bacterium]|nr:M48 family metallopeptidase [candidate division Zixibacteria bacterium]